MPDNPQDQHHWSTNWAYSKWPVAVKVASVVVAVSGGIGTILGLGGTIVKSVQNHDEAIRAQTIVAEQLKQRNDKIDNTLAYHGQQIWTIDKKLDGVDKKITRIESAVEKK